MNVKKFSANASREAWRMVRDALGPDAVILSNKTVNGVVEILALASEDMSSLASPAADKEPALSESTLAAFSAKRRVDQDQAAGLAGALESARVNALADTVSGTDLKEVMNEIRSMRGMLEAQLAEISWSSEQKREPVKAAVLRETLAAGFSASLARSEERRVGKECRL